MGKNILLHASPAPLDSAFLISAFFIIHTCILRSFTHILWSFRHAFSGFSHTHSVVFYIGILRLFTHAFSGHSHMHSPVFKCIGPVTCNSLPLSVRHSSSWYSFKSKLNIHLLFSVYRFVLSFPFHQPVTIVMHVFAVFVCVRAYALARVCVSAWG